MEVSRQGVTAEGGRLAAVRAGRAVTATTTGAVTIVTAVAVIATGRQKPRQSMQQK